MTLILGTLAFFFGGFGVSSFFAPGWPAATFLVFVQLAIFAWYLWKYRDGLVARILLFGLVLGFVELPGDAYWVVRDVLVYPSGEPMIYKSPFYMPFAYIPAILQFGYVGWWAAHRWPLWKACLGLAVMGGISMPMYETFAKDADFWFYQNVNMLMDATPYFIILAEVLLAVSLPLFLRNIGERPLWWAAVLGLAGGIWFDFTGPFSFWITG